MFKRKVRILFLDSENACQSQMAQGIAQKIGDIRLQVRSAGINVGTVHSNVVMAMSRMDIDISNQKPISVSPALLNWCDTVITLNNHARMNCPTLPAGSQHVHWPLVNPILLGTQEDIDVAFDQLRDRIKSRIDGLLGGLSMLSRSSYE